MCKQARKTSENNRRLIDLPSESSSVGQRLLRVLFQYLEERVSKYLSFCSSRMTLLTSSCRWLPCCTATA